MTSYLIDYCKQVDPVLLKVGKDGKQSFSGAMRRQESFTAIVEKRALLWLAERTPAWLSSDHLTLLGGLAVSGFMHPVIAIALLIGFLLLSIQSYLATYTLREFRLSFWRFGPTELRILLAIGSIALFFRPVVQIFGKRHRLFDVGGVIGVIGMGVMLVVWTAQNIHKLYTQERIR